MAKKLLNGDLQSIPITSEKEFDARKSQKKTIQKQNKQRAKDMERRVAKILAGQRTPQSGAGFMKGDVRVPFKHRHFMIECKLSSMVDTEPYITIIFDWLVKMEREAEAMRSFFAVLIIHFMKFKEDICLVPKPAWDQWFLPLPADVKTTQISVSLMRKVRRSFFMDMLPYGLLEINADRQYVVLELNELKNHVERSMGTSFDGVGQ